MFFFKVVLGINSSNCPRKYSKVYFFTNSSFMEYEILRNFFSKVAKEDGELSMFFL